MPRNLEVKIALDNFETVLKRLNELGAEKVAVLKQKDIYYEHGQGLLKLRVMPERSELIFYNRNESEGERWSDYHVLEIDKSQDAESFYAEIFKPIATVEKMRTLYLYDNTRIHLDEVKGLGKFLELETIVISTLEDAQRRFNFLVEKLGLDLSKQIKKSYKNLTEELR